MSDEIKAAVEAVEAKLSEAVSKYEAQVSENETATAAVREEVKALAKEHESLMKEAPELADRLKAVEQAVAEGPQPGEDVHKSMGQEFVESDQFKSYSDKGRAKIEVKNTILGEGGSPQDPESTLVPQDRLPGIVPGAFRNLAVLDFFPAGTTGSNQIEYTREASWTNNAAERAEAAEKPESALTFELVNDPVRTIAHFLKASRQVLDDAPMLASYIDRRMTHGVRRRLELQILRGNGTSPNIAGLSASGRHTAFTPGTGLNAIQNLNKAKYDVIASDYEPSVIFMNPADWGSIERDLADEDGIDVGISYIAAGLQPRVWGLPIVSSNNVEEGKFYCLAADATQLFVRSGVTVEMFEQDEDNVQHNLLTIRGEMRAALATYTPAAILYGDLTQ